MINSNGLAIGRDASSRIVSIAYPPGNVTYSYNNRGLLSKITDWAGASTTFAYDTSLRLTTIVRANGVTTQYSYDGDGHLSGIVESKGGAAISSITLQRDAAGRMTGAARTQPQAVSLAAGAISFTYDAAHQISGATYDALGRLVKDALRSYTFDLASRLTSYQGADGSASFTYDALGGRTARTEFGVTETYTLNYALGLPSVTVVNSGGADRRYYVYAPDGTLLYGIDAAGNQRHYYHFDESGNALFLSDDSGAVTDSYGATPYGENVTHAGSTINPFTWQGQFGVMQEGATSLYYMRARYYDSAPARFLSRDPVRSLAPNAIDPYQYALGDPARYIDPTGLSAHVPLTTMPVSSSCNSDCRGELSGFYQAIKSIADDEATLGFDRVLTAALVEQGFGALDPTLGLGQHSTYRPRQVGAAVEDRVVLEILSLDNPIGCLWLCYSQDAIDLQQYEIDLQQYRARLKEWNDKFHSITDNTVKQYHSLPPNAPIEKYNALIIQEDLRITALGPPPNEPHKPLKPIQPMLAAPWAGPWM
jgi:RHS repeat-associated protein